MDQGSTQSLLCFYIQYRTNPNSLCSNSSSTSENGGYEGIIESSVSRRGSRKYIEPLMFLYTCYKHAIDDILGVHKITAVHLKYANNDASIDLKTCNKMKNRKYINIICLNHDPNLRIPYIEQWVQVVAKYYEKRTHKYSRGGKEVLDRGSSISRDIKFIRKSFH